MTKDEFFKTLSFTLQMKKQDSLFKEYGQLRNPYEKELNDIFKMLSSFAVHKIQTEFADDEMCEKFVTEVLLKKGYFRYVFTLMFIQFLSKENLYKEEIEEHFVRFERAYAYCTQIFKNQLHEKEKLLKA